MGNIYLLIYYLIYLVAVFTVGSLFLKLFKLAFKNKIEKRVYEFALGNLIYSSIFIYLGIVHLLYGKLLLFFYLLPSFILLKKILSREISLGIRRKIDEFLKAKWETPEVFIFLFLFMVFVSLVPHIFVFPTSWDALAYHLMLPKIYLQDHFFSFYSWFAQTSMPIGIESLFGYGEVLREPRIANFIVFSFLAATVIYILYGLRYLFSRKVLFLALILFSFRSILFSSVSVNPFVDFPFAFYCLVSSMTLVKYFESQKMRTLILMLIFGLFCFMVKYVLGLVFLFAILVVFILNRDFKLRDYKKLFFSLKSQPIFLFILFVFLFPAVFWLLRNYIYFHNPFYIFFNNFFKGFDYDPINHRATMAEMRQGSFDFNVLINYLLHIPGDYKNFFAVFREALFSLILIVFPLAAIFDKEKTMRYFAVLGLVFSLAIYSVVGFPSYRYALAVAPVLALVTSQLFFKLFQKPRRWFKLSFAMILIISVSIQLIYTARTGIDFFCDNFRTVMKSALSYRGAVESLSLQDNYKGIDYLNKNLNKSHDKILVVFDNRLYYFDVPVIYANQSVNGIFTNPKTKTTKEIYEELKRMKVTYVFVNNNWGVYGNLRKDLFYPFVANYLEPVSSSSGTIVYEVK